MNINFNEVNNILNTLPIGYYVGRTIPVTLSNDEASYYDASNDSIHISYPTLEGVILKINDSHIEVETLVRTLLYHELSHAFLTPTEILMSNIINVFEDERIETICRDYYLNTNFLKLLMLVNNWDGKTVPKCKTKFESWYSLVRFRIGKPEFLKRVDSLINKYNDLNRDSTYWSRRYTDEVNDLYNNFCDDLREDKRNAELERNESEANDKNESNNKDESGDKTSTSARNKTTLGDKTNNSDTSAKADSTEVGEDTEDVENVEEEDDSTANTKQGDTLFFSNEEIKSKFEEAQTYYSASLNETLMNILVNANKMKSNTANAINAYSGVFDPRSVVNDNYKWFVQSSRQGNIKRFSKLKLNLFIDVSGSFGGNTDAVNTLLLSLAYIERKNPNFSFDLVTVGMEAKRKAKNERFIKCYGGNDIPDSTKQVINSVQDSSSSNYNIVLFDGDAMSDCRCSGDEAYSNFGFFNLPNTVMILDINNKHYADKYCPNVKCIYCENYMQMLTAQVISALTQLLK